MPTALIDGYSSVAFRGVVEASLGELIRRSLREPMEVMSSRAHLAMRLSAVGTPRASGSSPIGPFLLIFRQRHGRHLPDVKVAAGSSLSSPARAAGTECNLGRMPSPKRADLDDYYAQLPDVAVPHLTKLRELCQRGLPKAEEVLHWNTPAFVQEGTRLVMLQSYKQHCAVRFPTRLFASQREAVEAAGYEAGEGFIKLPYDRDLPIALLKRLIKARLDEFEAIGAGW